MAAELLKLGIAATPKPHLSINQLVVRAPDGGLRAFVGIDSSKGPIVGTANLRIAIASYGFLADAMFVDWDIADFAIGMASDDLLENIRLISADAGHVVTSTDEILAEVRTLGPRGYSLVTGANSNMGSANLMAAFAEGTGGKLF